MLGKGLRFAFSDHAPPHQGVVHYPTFARNFLADVGGRLRLARANPSFFALSGVSLQEAEAGAKVAELYREGGISEPTYCTWEGQFRQHDRLRRAALKDLEPENRKLKPRPAEREFDKAALKRLLPAQLVKLGV